MELVNLLGEFVFLILEIQIVFGNFIYFLHDYILSSSSFCFIFIFFVEFSLESGPEISLCLKTIENVRYL